jgi:transglutaminase-like putative cysteine protease
MINTEIGRSFLRCLLIFVALGCPAAAQPGSGVPASAEASPDGQTQPASRSFRLSYGGTIAGLAENAQVRVWIPVPPSNESQSVQLVSREIPGEMRETTGQAHGNRILYFETKAPADGELAFATVYDVERRKVSALDRAEANSAITQSERRRYLAANRKVPITGKPLNLLQGLEFGNAPLIVAHTLYEKVDAHVRYDKSEPGYGNGDVLWVCDSRFGNCTDFHSLFISLARSQNIPARFEIGFSLPAERGEGKIGGYHCWAQFFTDTQGWVPVDISEADKHPEMKGYYFGNLTADRAVFSMGRDIDLVPRQNGESLNYFVYPHIEVEGLVWPKEKTRLDFSYSDRTSE